MSDAATMVMATAAAADSEMVEDPLVLPHRPSHVSAGHEPVNLVMPWATAVSWASICVRVMGDVLMKGTTMPVVVLEHAAWQLATVHFWNAHAYRGTAAALP